MCLVAVRPIALRLLAVCRRTLACTFSFVFSPPKRHDPGILTLRIQYTSPEYPSLTTAANQEVFVKLPLVLSGANQES